MNRTQAEAAAEAILEPHVRAQEARSEELRVKRAAEDVLQARMVSDPLSVRDSCLVTDGGGALIITSAERAKDMPNALTVIAMAPRGTLLRAPDVYMDKLAIGPGYDKDVVSLDMTPTERVEALAKAGGVKPSDITVCILERPRHEDLIAEVRATGAAIRLITDGDVAGVIHCAEAELTGIDGIGAVLVDSLVTTFAQPTERASIDRLDAIIVYTLAERFKHTQSVGRLKAEHDLPPSDPAREAVQIERLERLAREADLDPEFARKFLNFVIAEVIRHHEQYQS